MPKVILPKIDLKKSTILWLLLLPLLAIIVIAAYFLHLPQGTLNGLV